MAGAWRFAYASTQYLRAIPGLPSIPMTGNTISTRLILVATGISILFMCGCVRRRLTIRSNPPGAIVYVDDQRIGATPVSTEFTYYGTRKIRLVRDGYETVSTLQTIDPPWYQIPPMDFVSENLVARELRDERVLEFQLQPQRLVSTQELLTRAGNLRTSSAQNVVAPLPMHPPLTSP